MPASAPRQRFLPGAGEPIPRAGVHDQVGDPPVAAEEDVPMRRCTRAALTRLSWIAAWPVVAAAGDFGRPPPLVRLLPEPSTLLLIGVALLGVVVVARLAQKRRSRRKD